MSVTKLAQMVNPEVMADMISATLPYHLKFTKIASIDATLQGQPGDTITVPKYGYIGNAEDVAEGVAMDITQMSTSTTTVSVKKIGKAIELSDEAMLSGYGDPVGEASRQLTLAIAHKIDLDVQKALEGAPTHKDVTTANINYNGIVDALDLFEEESDLEKAIFVHPSQVSQLRKDVNFIDYAKYPQQVLMTGEIGQIAGVRVIKSKAVTKKEVSGVQCYVNPIVVLSVEDPKQATTADGGMNTKDAVTIYSKREAMVETDRNIVNGTTVFTANKHYGVALSNESKVVVANFKA